MSKYVESRNRVEAALASFQKYLSNAVPELTVTHVHEGPIDWPNRGYAEHLKGMDGVYVLYDGEGCIVYIGKAFGERGLEARIRHGIMKWPIDVDNFDIDLIRCPRNFEFILTGLEQYLIAAFPECKGQKGHAIRNPNWEQF